ANPDLQLEHLPAEVSLRNEGGAAMFYHAQFSSQDVRHRTSQWGPLKHERIEVFQPGASEDIALLIVEGGSGMVGSLVYNSALFHDRTIGRLRDRFLELLRQVAIDPGQSLSTLLAFDDAGAAGVGAVEDPDGAVDVARRQSPESEAVPATMPAGADPRETYLIELWSEMLGTVVLPSDNFFDVGGNSLLAMQMAERVARRTGYRIKLMQLAVQSVAHIAAEMPADAAVPEQPGAGLKPIRNMKRLFGKQAAAEERGGC